MVAAQEIYEKAVALDKAGDSAGAFKWMLLSAQQGSINGQYAVGLWYGQGHGTEKNILESFRWLARAVKQGHGGADAFWEVQRDDVVYGAVELLYQSNDMKEAFTLCHRLALKGYAPAQFMLGHMLSNGKGVAVHKKPALKWYLKAAEQGDVSA